MSHLAILLAALLAASPARAQERPAAPAFEAASDRASLFTALQEQLGLKLESRIGPVDVLVIEQLERPTGN